MRIGFAGLGRMGGLMARDIASAGFDLTFWNRRWHKEQVFYGSIGHALDNLKTPQVTEIIRRAPFWAVAGKHI